MQRVTPDYEILIHKEVDKKNLSNKVKADVHLICLKILNVKSYASNAIKYINDTSWVKELAPVPQYAYSATVERTISKLVKIFKKVDNDVTSDFGEFMISLSSAQSLSQQLDHVVFPLSELWKEKVTGNHGFDFHTESPRNYISFGEAKYNASHSSYGKAASQVVDFINDEKDRADLPHLTHIASEQAINEFMANKRGFCVAFSIHSDNYLNILENTLNNQHIIQLYQECDELFIIGVMS